MIGAGSDSANNFPFQDLRKRNSSVIFTLRQVSGKYTAKSYC